MPGRETRTRPLLVTRAYVPEALLPAGEADGWPFDVPAVAELVEQGLTFERPITFLVGENGSGKSTIVEAIAEAYGLDARGGRAGRKYGNQRPRSELGEVMRLSTTAVGARLRGGPRGRNKGFFLRAETAFGFMNEVSGRHGYWQEDVEAMSHGEGFLTVIGAMVREPGLYLMDEPEAALSFTSCLGLVGHLERIAAAGGQLICATHSPVLAAAPGAAILELGAHGVRRTAWADLELVDHWRRYLAAPERYLTTLVESAGEDQP